MGMDIIGNNPTTKKGEYFRNNVWWWRPLADFCINRYADEVGFDGEGWHYNDGNGLNAEQAEQLARLIRADLDDGSVELYEKKYNEMRADLPRQVCNICDGSGIRTDDVGVEMGQPTKELKPEVQILTQRTHGWCNGCDGVGSTEHWLAGYPFEVSNVREFCEFLEGCGGFSIW